MRARLEGDQVHVSVSDTGIGIRKVDLGRLFEPFERLENPLARQAGGTGLGLAISKKFVELHGGQMWVESRESLGSTFHFTLPAAPEPDGDPALVTAPAPLRPGRGIKILHIEDNPENRALVRALLEAEGYALVEAEDGLSGIEAALREEPALILLDINLPGVDGYEVGVILKSFPSLSATPVIAVTAYAMEGDRQRTLVAGCDGYLQKPIDVDRFPRQVASSSAASARGWRSVEAGPYLRELNQRLVYRLVNQVEELKRLNQHFVRRAVQLEDLHEAVQDITAEMGRGAHARAAAAGAGPGPGHGEPHRRADRAGGHAGDRRGAAGRTQPPACSRARARGGMDRSRVDPPAHRARPQPWAP